MIYIFIIITIIVLVWFIISLFINDNFKITITYKNHELTLTKKNQYIIFLLYIPFIKNIIKDVIKSNAMLEIVHKNHQKIMMLTPWHQDISDLTKKIKMCERSVKLTQLKYKKKNFIIRKIFLTFVK